MDLSKYYYIPNLKQILKVLKIVKSSDVFKGESQDDYVRGYVNGYNKALQDVLEELKS